MSHKHSQSFQSQNIVISFVGDTQDTAVYIQLINSLADVNFGGYCYALKSCVLKEACNYELLC